MSKKKVPGKGDPCPRCSRLMQIREHPKITAKMLKQPFYYSRWYYCANQKCRTTVVTPEKFKVWNNNERGEELHRLSAIHEQLSGVGDWLLEEETRTQTGAPPWEDGPGPE